MSLDSSISWTDATYNPWRGCLKTSPGCKHCYAERGAERNPAVLGSWKPGAPRIIGAPEYFRTPDQLSNKALKEGVRKKIFCLSYGDFFEDYDGFVMNPKGGTQIVNAFGEFVTGNPFEEGVTPLHLDHIRAIVLGQIARSPLLVWLILTKRPEHIVPTLERLATKYESPVAKRWLDGKPPANAMLMASVENQEYADRRIPELLKAPAAMRGLSVEPLLGPVQVRYPIHHEHPSGLPEKSWTNFGYPLSGEETTNGGSWINPKMTRIDWVIVGGESEPQGEARECKIEWILDVVKQCQDAGVPCFVKQDSGKQSDQQGRIPDWAWKIKEFPEAFA